jgi:hypothetical protein
VVQHGCFGRAGGAGVVMCRDRVQQLGADVGLERRGARLDESETKVDVPQEPALFRLTESRAGTQLGGASYVVEERRREQEIAAEALMKLCRLATDGRDADCVLEEPTCV